MRTGTGVIAILLAVFILNPLFCDDIQFENTTLESLIKLISKKTGKNFLYDANDSQFRQKFKLTVTEIDDASLYKLFHSIMEMRGYSLIEFEDFIKVVPVAKSRPSDSDLYSIDTVKQLSDEEKLVSMFIRLNFADAQEVLNIINQMRSDKARAIKIDEGSLLIYEYASRINKILEVIKSVDIAPEPTVTKVITLLYARAADMQGMLTKIFQDKAAAVPGHGPQKPSERIKIFADKRLNALVVNGLESEIKELEILTAKLDIKPAEEQTEIHIINLKNGDAETISKKLQDVYADKQKRAKTPGGNGGVNSMDEIPSIVPHEGTNSLIVISPPDVFKELKEIVDKLDKKKDKVLIEALIVETSYNKLHDLGVELASVKTNPDATYNVFGGSLFGMSTPGVGSSGEFTRTPAPTTYGATAGLIYENDFTKLPLLIIAAQKDENVNISAQPQIVANNNEEALFESSLQVPTVKTNVGSGGDIISTSAEYYTASMKLNITPHITDDEYLRLEIEQDTERFDLATAAGGLPPLKTARKAKTTVTIPNNSTVLLGGLQSEDGSWSEKKVPILGDIPFIRHFFRRKTYARNDSSVFVFITAHIIRSENEYLEISEAKRKGIETFKELHEDYKKKSKNKR